MSKQRVKSWGVLHHFPTPGGLSISARKEGAREIDDNFLAPEVTAMSRQFPFHVTNHGSDRRQVPLT